MGRLGAVRAAVVTAATLAALAACGGEGSKGHFMPTGASSEAGGGVGGGAPTVAGSNTGGAALSGGTDGEGTTAGGAATPGGGAAGSDGGAETHGGAAGAGLSGSAGNAGAGGTDGKSCQAVALADLPDLSPTYRVPLRVHRTRSDLDDAELCRVLEEVNRIWWLQAAICFEIEVVAGDETAGAGFDIWFERQAPFPNGVDANGVYSGRHEVYSLDHPSLGAAPNPVMNLTARTAAHELGHGLSLAHQNCGQDCSDLLMTSGKRGFQLVSGAPASDDEIASARQRASTLALDDATPTACGAPKLPN